MKRFKKVYIEITNRCNLSCEFCPKTSRELKRNKEEDFLHIIKEVINYTDHIYLHLLGEPTMHPELARFLEISSEYGLKVNLTTNGTLLHKVKDVLMSAPALRQINISLHSFEVNDPQVGLEEYIGRITRFINEANVKSEVICSLRLWNMDNETIKAKNTLNQYIISLLEEQLGIDFSIEEALKEKDGIKLKERVYLNKAKKFEWPHKERAIIDEAVFCYGLRDQIGILVDGTVVPCCLDGEGHMALGNIFERPLGEILEGERSKAIYEGFSKRKAVEHLCKRCGYATRYSKKKATDK